MANNNKTSIALFFAFSLFTTRPVPVSNRVCSSQVTQGPYHFAEQKTEFPLSSSYKSWVYKYWVESDAEIMIAYRGYWKSFCYNGGALDPNTGCYDEYKDYLPDEMEVREWHQERKCKVQNDCNDCWGSDSDQCTGDWLHNRPWHFTEHKELNRTTSNNHFAHHTCNLQWRCGFHTSGWPTFLQKRGFELESYIMMKDNTPFSLRATSYHRFSDFVLYKTKDPLIKSKQMSLGCHGMNDTICFDEESGNFLEFQKSEDICIQRTCYSLLSTDKEQNRIQRQVDLKAASIEDLKDMFRNLHLLHEEMKYNFALVKKENAELKRTLQILVKSLGKIDDRLVGEVLEQPARTKFLSKDQFLLSPCSEDPPTTSNCVNNSIYSDGRWVLNTDPSKCITFNASKELHIWNDTHYWLPDVVEHKALGIVGDQEGWSFYAKEKENLKESLSFSHNMGKTSSLGDAFSMPAGYLSGSIWHLKVLTIAVICASIVVALCLIKICLRLFH